MITLYHGTSRLFSNVDLSLAGQNYGVGLAGPEFYVTGSPNKVSDWAWGAIGGKKSTVILKAEFDPDTFAIINGHEHPSKVLQREALERVLQDMLGSREEEVMDYINDRYRNRTFDPPVGKAAADYLLGTQSMLSAKGFRGYDNFIGLSRDLFMAMHSDAGLSAAERRAWDDVEHLLQRLGVDAIDIWGDRSEVAIYQSGLEKMPAWQLSSTNGCDAELDDVGLRRGDVVIAAGNMAPNAPARPPGAPTASDAEKGRALPEVR